MSLTTIDITHPLTGEIIASPGLSLDLPEGMQFSEWQDCGVKLCAMAKGINWWIGDWWAYGSHRYGERATLWGVLFWGLGQHILARTVFPILEEV